MPSSALQLLLKAALYYRDPQCSTFRTLAAPSKAWSVLCRTCSADMLQACRTGTAQDQPAKVNRVPLVLPHELSQHRYQMHMTQSAQITSSPLSTCSVHYRRQLPQIQALLGGEFEAGATCLLCSSAAATSSTAAHSSGAFSSRLASFSSSSSSSSSKQARPEHEVGASSLQSWEDGGHSRQGEPSQELARMIERLKTLRGAEELLVLQRNHFRQVNVKGMHNF